MTPSRRGARTDKKRHASLRQQGGQRKVQSPTLFLCLHSLAHTFHCPRRAQGNGMGAEECHKSIQPYFRPRFSSSPKSALARASLRIREAQEAGGFTLNRPFGSGKLTPREEATCYEHTDR